MLRFSHSELRAMSRRGPVDDCQIFLVCDSFMHACMQVRSGLEGRAGRLSASRCRLCLLIHVLAVLYTLRAGISGGFI